MKKAPWVNFRPEIKILDCTIRDGGLINNHVFEDGLVKAVYQTCVAAGIDYIEIGYKSDKKIFAQDEFGAWKYCDEDIIRRIVGDNESGTKISVMADAEKSDYKRDIGPKDHSVIDMIRVATYIHQIPTAVNMIKHAKDCGYEAAVNLMAMSTVQDSEIEEALDIFSKTDVDVIVLVDSYGSLYSEQVRDYSRRYLKAAKKMNKEVGIHAHNNQQLAFANTIEAVVAGVNRLDATMHGFGRGAGNCPMELLLGFLRNPKFKLRPVLQCIQDHFIPLLQKLEWGPLIPYMITAQFNQHPRSAIKLRAGKDRDNIVDFYDRWVEELE
jgi:4-hydroxy 2-oxovalerate aldolase